MRTFYTKAKLSILSIFTIACFSANATTYPINVTLSGSQEVPSNGSAATATFVGTFNDVTDSLIFTVTFSGMTDSVTAAHFHGYVPPGISGPIRIPAVGFPIGVLSGTYTAAIMLTPGQRDSLKLGLMYFNIHSKANPGGEIRAQLFLQNSGYTVPVINCPRDTSVTAPQGLCSDTLAFAATVISGNPPTALYYRIGNTAITSPNGFTVGTTTVIAIGLNAAGYDTCQFHVTVIDTQPPHVTCPANVVQANDSGQCGAIVNYPPAVAIDNCSGVTVTYSQAAGTFFPVGTTTVTVTATDGSGNTDSCSFTVTVNDVEPPVISNISANPDVLWPPNHQMKSVSIDYTVTDNCPGVITSVLTVTSNQPINGTGDGNTNTDWQVIDDHHVDLRAERAGNLGCRIYYVKITSTDAHGNSSDTVVRVVVPHDMSGRHLCTDSSSGIHPHSAMIRHWIDISILRNPSGTSFPIRIESSSLNQSATIRIIDMYGRVVETREGVMPNQTIEMGATLKVGAYIVEVRQGDQVTETKILKFN